MKNFSLMMLLAVLGIAGSAFGVTYDLNDVLLNAGFDMDPSAYGSGVPFTDSSSFDYRPLETDPVSAGALGWYKLSGENTTGYYWRSDDKTVEYTRPNCLAMDNYSNGDWCGVYQSFNVDINAGDTVTWTFYLKQWPGVNLPSYMNVHLYSAETGWLNNLHIANTQMGTTEWSEHTYTYTHSGSTILAGSLIFGFDMHTYYPGTNYHGILIDAEGPELNLLAGDANRDGIVSAGDYVSIQSHFGEADYPGMLGDANGDGVVSDADFASVQANFGNTTVASSVPVPEPLSVSILCLGSGAALIRRRKLI